MRIMIWSGLIGHEKQRQWFETAVRKRRLASTFLLVGPSGCGKRAFALRVSKALLCHRRPPDTLDFCGLCESCVQADAGTHPDLLLVQKPCDKASLPMELLVGSPENRLRDGICYQLHVRPFHGYRRIAIIDDADTIQIEGANSMLKTLEEPPAGSIIFLIGSNEQRQLATIRSRSQIIRFQGLTSQEILELLVLQIPHVDRTHAAKAADLAQGSVAKARLLLDDEVRDLKREIDVSLEQRPLPFVQLAKSLSHSLQSLGDESQAKRERLKIIFDFAVEHYRTRLMALPAMVSKAQPSSSTADSHAEVRQLAESIAACLRAQVDVDRNVTPAALLESWASELAMIGGAS